MPARRLTLTGANLLVLQHIACEPPGAYEDELLDRGGGLCRVMVDRGEPLPDWRTDRRRRARPGIPDDA